jgi:AcrR family transcriptional regulator
MKMQNAKNKTAKSALTLERILDAAAESFSKEGYQNTKLTRVAADSGLSRAGLYKYFSTKESLLLALHGRMVHETVARANSILGNDAPALVVIENWLRDVLCNEKIRRDVRTLTLNDVQAELLLDQEETPNALKKVRLALVRVIKRGIQEGDIAPTVNPGDTAHMLQALAISLNRNSMSDRPVVDLAEMRHVDALLAALVGGLRRT